jgi:hypothetical protein
MAELFIKHKTTPYLFDTKLSKLFWLIGDNRVEIKSPEILSDVRLGATEINRERAFRLAFEYKK